MLVEVEPALPEELLGDGVERAGGDPLGQAEPRESTSQLAGGLTGEGEHDRVGEIGGADRDPVGDPAGQHAGLARPRPGDDGDE